MATNLFTFTSALLNIDNQYELTHNLGTENIVPAWFDADGVQQSTAGLFEVVDSNNIVLNCNHVISGTHSLLLQYDAGTVAITGRRIFERDLFSSQPDDSMRTALGKAGTPSKNLTWGSLKNYLSTSLGSLKILNNLTDLNSPSIARESLQVYSKTETDNKIDPKATLLRAGSGAVLGVNNEAEYLPANPFNPATVKYVDDATTKAGSAFSQTGQDTKITLTTLDVRRDGQVVALNGKFQTSAGVYDFGLIGTINDSNFHPSSDREFTGSIYVPYGSASLYNQVCVFRIDTLGRVYVHAPEITPGSFYYVIDITYITG